MRLGGAEGVRRAPSPISTVEDALLELVRNAHEAGARNIYVASTLRRRRYRVLTILDDGCGIPEPYRHLIFDPGVTSRHHSDASAGLSLHHIDEAATSIRLTSLANPTSITAVFDTQNLPERTLQSTSRPSESNLRATLERFHSRESNPPRIHYGPPTKILATLIHNHIIQNSMRGIVSGEVSMVLSRVRDLGLEVSHRSVRRVLSGVVSRAAEVPGNTDPDERGTVTGGGGGVGAGGFAVTMRLSDKEMEEIETILNRAASARYLEVGQLRLESRSGEIMIRARISETEEEYE